MTSSHYQQELTIVAVVQLLGLVRLFATPWTASLPSTISQSLLRFMSIESVMLSNHLILCHLLYSTANSAQHPVIIWKRIDVRICTTESLCCTPERVTKLLITYVYVCAQSPSCVWFFATLWTVARQAPLSMEFFRQEYWSGLPYFSSRGSSWPRYRTCFLHWQEDSLPLSHLGSPHRGKQKDVILHR